MISKKISMKSKLTPEISELCGIVAGDGHLSRHISEKRSDYKLIISGHKEDDKEYFVIIQQFFKKVLDITLKPYQTYYGELRAYSKKAVEYFENLGIPVGNKSAIIFVPDKIKCNIELSCAFLRGLADTDFSVVLRKRKRSPPYPRITCDFKSPFIVKDICKLLKKLDIGYCGPYKRNSFRNKTRCITYEIDINGHENLKKWMKHISFRNPKHLNKIKKIEDAGILNKSPLPDLNRRFRAPLK